MNIFEQFLFHFKTVEHKELEIKKYIESGEFLNSLQSVISNKEEIISICNNSTKHSNNFLKIVLASVDGWKMRLHIWPVENFNQYHEPHNHRWDFTSYVLSGKIGNQIVTEDTETAQTFLKCYAGKTKINSKRSYEVNGKCGIKLLKEDLHQKNNIYSMKQEYIHIAKIPKNTFTSTLFITSEAKVETSNVYMPDLKEPPSNISLDSVEVFLLERQLKKIIKEIS